MICSGDGMSIDWHSTRSVSCKVKSVYINFFFQAEDGIRDYKVTGVQTCALPIFAPRLKSSKIPCLSSSGTPGPSSSTPRRRSRSEEHTSELQSPCNLVCRLLLEKKKETPVRWR